MDGRYSQRDVERVLTRAIELDATDPGAPDASALMRIAAELEIDEGAVRRALIEHSLPTPKPSLLDRALGPPRVAAGFAADVPAAAASQTVERYMLSRWLSPATRPGVWLQQRGRWPDPNAGTSVPTLHTQVRPSEAGTAIVMTAGLEDSRSGFLLAFIVTLMAAVMVAVVLPGWAGSWALAGGIGAGWAMRSAYQRHLDATTNGLRSGIAEIEQLLSRLPAASLASDDAPGVLVERPSFDDAPGSEAAQVER
jgi:hypothetical protein